MSKLLQSCYIMIVADINNMSVFCWFCHLLVFRRSATVVFPQVITRLKVNMWQKKGVFDFFNVKNPVASWASTPYMNKLVNQISKSRNKRGRWWRSFCTHVFPIPWSWGVSMFKCWYGFLLVLHPQHHLHQRCPSCKTKTLMVTRRTSLCSILHLTFTMMKSL